MRQIIIPLATVGSTPSPSSSTAAIATGTGKIPALPVPPSAADSPLLDRAHTRRKQNGSNSTTNINNISSNFTPSTSTAASYAASAAAPTSSTTTSPANVLSPTSATLSSPHVSSPLKPSHSKSPSTSSPISPKNLSSITNDSTLSPFDGRSPKSPAPTTSAVLSSPDSALPSREASIKIGTVASTPSIGISPNSTRFHPRDVSGKSVAAKFENQPTLTSIMSSPFSDIGSSVYENMEDLDEDLQAQIKAWVHVGRSLLKRVQVQRHPSSTSSVQDDPTVRVFAHMVKLFEAEVKEELHAEDYAADDSLLKKDTVVVPRTTPLSTVSDAIIVGETRESFSAEIIDTEAASSSIPASSHPDPIALLCDALRSPSNSDDTRKNIDQCLSQFKESQFAQIPSDLFVPSVTCNHLHLFTLILTHSHPSPSHDDLRSALLISSTSGFTDIVSAILSKITIATEPMVNSAISNRSGKLPAIVTSPQTIDAQHAAMALWCAFRNGHLAAARAVFNAMPTKLANGVVGMEHIAYASYRGDGELLDWALLKKRKGYAGDIDAVLTIARQADVSAVLAKRGEEETVATLLKLSGSDWSAVALVLAVGGGYKDCVQSLIQAGVNTKWRKSFVMGVAEREGKAEILRMLAQTNKEQSAFAWTKKKSGSFGEETVGAGSGVAGPPSSSQSWIDRWLGGKKTKSKTDVEAAAAAAAATATAIAMPEAASSSSPRGSRRLLLKAASFHGKWGSKKDIHIDTDFRASSHSVTTEIPGTPIKKHSSTSNSAPNLCPPENVVFVSASSLAVRRDKDADEISVTRVDEVPKSVETIPERVEKEMTVDVMQRDSASRKEETVVAERSRIETETFKVDELVQSNAHDLPGSIPSVTVTPQLTRKDKPAEVLLQKVIVEVKTSFDPVEEQNHKAHSLPTPPLEVPSDETSPVGVNVPVAPPPPPPGAVKIRVEDVGTSNENLGRKSVEAITACRAKAERLPATLIALPISVQARIADHLDILSIFHLTATHRSLHLHRSLHHARHLVRSSTDGIPGSIRALLTSPSPLHIHDGPSHAEKILMHILKILNPCIEDEIAKGPNVGTAGFRSARAGFIGNPGRRLGPRALDPLLEFAIAEGFSWAVSKLLYAGSTSKSSLNRFLGRCAESGDTVAAVAFLGAGADPNASINFPVIEFHGGGFGNVDGSCLAVAAAMGNEGVVAALLEAGADASLFESLALRACAASTLGTGEIAARLILGGADPASHAHEAIRRAALRGSPGVLRVLVGVIAGTVKVKWEVRSVIRVAYESAAKAGHAEAVREMLKERQTWMWGSGLEGPGSVLRTAVLAAIGGGWVEVVRAFAESEAWGDVVAGEDGKGVVEAALGGLGEEDGDVPVAKTKALVRSLAGSRVSLEGDARKSLEQLNRGELGDGVREALVAVDDSYDESNPVAILAAEMLEAILAGAAKVGRARYPTAFYGGTESASARTKIDAWELLRCSDRLRRLRKLLLLQAASLGHETVVDAVLSTLQPDILSPSKTSSKSLGQRALCAAVETGNAKMVARLISAGVEFEFEDGMLFTIAKEKGFEEVLKFLFLSKEVHGKRRERERERDLKKMRKEHRVEPPL